MLDRNILLQNSLRDESEASCVAVIQNVPAIFPWMTSLKFMWNFLGAVPELSHLSLTVTSQKSITIKKNAVQVFVHYLKTNLITSKMYLFIFLILWTFFYETDSGCKGKQLHQQAGVLLSRASQRLRGSIIDRGCGYAADVVPSGC